MLQQEDVQGALEGTASQLNPNVHSRVDAGTFLNEKLYKFHMYVYYMHISPQTFVQNGQYNRPDKKNRECQRKKNISYACLYFSLHYFIPASDLSIVLSGDITVYTTLYSLSVITLCHFCMEMVVKSGRNLCSLRSLCLPTSR